MNTGQPAYVPYVRNDVTVTQSPTVGDAIAEGLVTKANALTEKERKQLMRQFFTVRHPKASCGHSLDLGTEPRTNCEVCWFTWFNSHGELVQTVDEMFQKHGGATIEVMRGTKFLKMFLKFMSTVANVTVPVEEPNVESTASTSLIG